MLFLSYAKEDGEIGRQIAEWFVSKDITVYFWQDAQQRGGEFIRQIEGAIKNSDAFLVLLSPSFLASRWCDQERQLAMQREKDLRDSGAAHSFVHVLKIRDTPSSDAGFLRIYDWRDLTSPGNREQELGELAGRLGLTSPPKSTDADAASASRGAPVFRNREDELNKVVHGLTNAGGQHFWLVIAPPQLGKTWFLNQVCAKLAAAEPSPWETKLVSLRDQPAEVHSDTASLLGLLFGVPAPASTERRALVGVAQGISRGGRSHLCLLDGAELLKQETAAALRSCLSEVSHLLREYGGIEIRLGVVVASRHEDAWRGVTPAPRLYAQPLTEFKVDVVQQALSDLAADMGRKNFGSAVLMQQAALVHRLTEGLPALLTRCLDWIREEEWYELERLESQELFEEIANTYIQDGLLSQDSLVRWRRDRVNKQLAALTQAFRVLAPYRLFTQSHLRHHFEPDPVLRRALDGLGWSVGDLWDAISHTALLTRPLDEPWQEIHPAIRRLLYRYYYTSTEQRAAAHREARKFVEVWADQQAGKEQVIGLVECLWHEAADLRLTRPAEMRGALSESAKTLSQDLRPSPAYTLSELRGYAAERMLDDEEFQDAVSDVAGLFTRLVEIVVAPR